MTNTRPHPDTTRIQSFLARVPGMPTSKIVRYLSNIELVTTAVGAGTEWVLAASAALENELDRRIPVPKEAQP